MGTEISLQKNRTVSPCDEGMSHRMRNNFHPLHFHQVHGDNIRLMKNGAVACRPEGFCKGIAFSDRPVMICEPVYIRFLEISSNWSGALRIGFTMNDPASMKSKLPRYACPDLTSMNGNWAKAIAERMAKKDSILYYYVDQNGDVHYGIDSEHHGIFFGGVNTSGKLWAVMDIYGNTVAVEFVNPNALNTEIVPDSPCVNESTSLTRNNIPNSATALITQLNFTLSFHLTHGKNVALNNFRTVASTKSSLSNNAYVFTERSMQLGEKIVIQILQTNLVSSEHFVYGITSCNPSRLNPGVLPENPDDLMDRPEYWIVKSDTNFYERGDIIVYSINTQGQVIVMKNTDYKSAIFHVDPTQPLWLFFNLIGSISELRIVGSSISDETSEITHKLEDMKVSLPNKSKLTALPGPSSQQSYTECVICYEEPVNCALYRCGHMCLCYDCAMKMWRPNSNVQCPLCRETIQDVIKIYR